MVRAEGGIEGRGGVPSRGEEGHLTGDGEGAIWGRRGEEEDLRMEPVAGKGLVSSLKGKRGYIGSP